MNGLTEREYRDEQQGLGLGKHENDNAFPLMEAIEGRKKGS